MNSPVGDMALTMDVLNLTPKQLVALSEKIGANDDEALTDFLGALNDALVNHPVDGGAHADALYMLGLKLTDHHVLQKIGAARLVANLDGVPDRVFDLFVDGLPDALKNDVAHERSIKRRVAEKTTNEAANLSVRRDVDILDAIERYVTKASARPSSAEAQSEKVLKKRPMIVGRGNLKLQRRIHPVKARELDKIFAAGEQAGRKEVLMEIVTGIFANQPPPTSAVQEREEKYKLGR